MQKHWRGLRKPPPWELRDDLRALLFTKIEKAVKELPLEEKVVEALVNDVLVSVRSNRFALRNVIIDLAVCREKTAA